MQRLVNTAGESKLPNKAITDFAWSLKEHTAFLQPDGRWCVSYRVILDAFHWELLSVGLIGVNHLVFQKELIIEDPLHTYTQTHHTYNITFFGWSPAFVVGGGSFHLPHNLFHSALLSSIHFSLPIPICLKNGMFSLHFSRELWHVEIWSRFFHLTYVEPIPQSDEHYQAGANHFQCLIWMFWVCLLSPIWCSVDHFQCLDLIAINLNWSTWPWSIIQWNLQHKTLQTTFDAFNQSQHLLHSLHKSFFAFQLHFCLSWNISN